MTPRLPESLVLGFPAESVTAVATLILALVTAALVIATILLFLVARGQLPLLSAQLQALAKQVTLAREADAASQRRYIEANTLQACARYTGDPVIHEATQSIWRASNSGTDYRGNLDKLDMHDLITALNYLDGIAVGVKQGVYSGAIIKDHMMTTYVKVVDVIIPEAMGGDFSDYEAILELRNSWRSPIPVSYHPGGTSD